MKRKVNRDNLHTLPIAQAYVEQMAATQQNPRYHAEGNVLEHTRMVLGKFFELKSRFSLTQEEEKILYWAAVLHDIGKPVATQLVEGRWKSPGHEKAGLPIARDILMAQADISAEQRRRILDLVRWHGFPLHWALGKEPVEKLKSLNLRTDLRLLGIFAYFDMHGRICEDQDLVLRMMQHFIEVDVPRVEYEMGTHQQMMAHYQGWSRKKKNAAWSAVRMDRIALVEKLIDTEPRPEFDYDQFMGVANPSRKVVMTVGPSMAGKTSWLQGQFPEGFHVQLKDFQLTEDIVSDTFKTGRLMVEFKYHLSLYTRQIETILLDGRNLHEGLRHQITDAARSLNADIEYVVFENTLEQALALNAVQESPLSEELVREQYHQFDLLHPWEAHHMRFVAPLTEKVER